jgi:hypothetical protein
MIMEKKRYETEEEMILWNEISKSLNYNKDRIDNVLFDEEVYQGILSAMREYHKYVEKEG